LTEDLECKVELFASPINRSTRIDIYGSLFHDTDSHFGSMGSYVGLMAEKRLKGFMQAHPPPIEIICDDFVDRAIVEMNAGDRPLGFVVALPMWKDTKFYKQAIENPHCRKVVMASKYLEDEECEELAELYFTYYSPVSNKDVPMPKKDLSFIVVLANDLLYNSGGVRDVLDKNFPL
jgi:hypothetical protein